MIYRENIVVKTEPVPKVKEEPISNTNEEREGVEQQQDVKPLIGENSNVIVKQQQQEEEKQLPTPPPSPLDLQPQPLQQLQSTDDFENDPEAGPSGLQKEPISNTANCTQKPMLRYPNDSSDDESGDDREMAMWRPPAAFRFSRTEDDSRFIVDRWRYDQAANNNDSSNFSDLAAQSATNNPTDEVIDLSENDSNATVQNAPINVQSTHGHEVLHTVITAPDLQLDWLSDSSSDNEIVCTIHDRHASAAKKSQSNVSAENDESNDDVPAIDLTASDDEDTSFTREDTSNGPSSIGYNMIRDKFTHYGSVMRSSNYHDDNRNDR